MNPRQGGHPQYTQENGIAMQPSYNALSIGVQSPAPRNIGGPSHFNFGAGSNLNNSIALADTFIQGGVGVIPSNNQQSDKINYYKASSLDKKVFPLEEQQMKDLLIPKVYDEFDEELKRRFDQQQQRINNLQAILNKEMQAAAELKSLNLSNQNAHGLSK